MKTLLATLFLTAAFITTAHAQPRITAMEPISDRGERRVSIEEVTENIESQYSGSRFERAEEHEDSRRESIDEHGLDDDAKRDIYCLTEAIYFESLGEPKDGKVAVATVIMNRAKWEPTNDRNKHHYEFSKSICDVVAFNISKTYKKKVGRGKHAKWINRKITTCAFSYRCERGFRTKLARAKQREVWHEIKALATDTYVEYNNGTIEDPSGGATFYHATWMKRYPWWHKAYERTAKIGQHQFYKIK